MAWPAAITLTGSKSIIAASAIAKFGFRLVPDQDPQKIARVFRDHITRITPAEVRSSVRTYAPIEPALVDRNHPALKAAAFAYKKGFGASPVFIRSGGSIPVVNTFQQILGCPAVLMGFGLPDDQIHGPNEKFHSPQLLQGDCHQHLVLGSLRKTTQRTIDRERKRKRNGRADSMIIDCHCHAGRGDRMTAPWNTIAPLKSYLRRARAAGIDKTIVIPAFHSNYAQANEELGRIVARHPRRLLGFAFVHARRDAGRIREMVGRAVEKWNFRGIKVHGFDAMPTREVCETARAFRLPILVDVVSRPEVIDMFAPQYPDVNFIIPHLGSFTDDWKVISR